MNFRPGDRVCLLYPNDLANVLNGRVGTIKNSWRSIANRDDAYIVVWDDPVCPTHRPPYTTIENVIRLVPAADYSHLSVFMGL